MRGTTFKLGSSLTTVEQFWFHLHVVELKIINTNITCVSPGIVRRTGGAVALEMLTVAITSKPLSAARATEHVKDSAPSQVTRRSTAPFPFWDLWSGCKTLLSKPLVLLHVSKPGSFPKALGKSSKNGGKMVAFYDFSDA